MIFTKRNIILAISLVLMVAARCCVACRSSDDPERDSYTSHAGTEPPKPTKPVNEGLKPHPHPGAGAGGESIDPDHHEEGEVQINSRWEFPVAQTKMGKVWGTIEESRAGKRILAFRGLRYARSPEGPLRFQPPVPVTSWTGIMDAKENGHVCPQHMYYKPDVWIGKEDCLWLNVFTRDLVIKRQRPVIVWIHGGNFIRGSAAEYMPDYILDEDVVLVTINYRLGMFGFLSTEDKEAPGNYGMLDQVAALRWVKNNIEAFAGDPNRITIMGQQAGGASVHYHLLSPLSRGLFNRAVSLSGTALCWWASIKRPLEKAIKLGKLQKCPYRIAPDGSSMYGDDTTEGLIKCLREKTMESLMNSHPNFYEWKHLEQTQEPVSAWSPRVDAPASPRPFMPTEPIDLIQGGNFQYVPWILGLTEDEGAFKVSTLMNDPKAVEELNLKAAELTPLILGFHDGQTEAPKIQGKSVQDQYWGPKLTEEVAKKLVDAVSDSSYAHPIDTAAKVHALKSKAPVFMYHFRYKGSNSFTQLSSNTYPPKQIDKGVVKYGVGNGDDLIYLFPVLSGTFRPLPHSDLIFSQRLIQLFTSFAVDGQPRVQMDGNSTFVWEPVVGNNARHLDISAEWNMDNGLPNHDKMGFWHSIPAYWSCDRENFKPAPPVAYKDEL